MSNLSDLINKDDDFSYNYAKVEPTTVAAPTAYGQQFAEEAAAAVQTKSPEPAIPAAAPKESDSSGKVPQETILNSFEKIKTHFPAARIKKIMQLDEEIGKVAQATPIIVGRALEIFMANLVEASIIEARRQGVKRISASHIRTAVDNTEQFDFLVEAVEKYPPVKNWKKSIKVNS